MVVLVSVFTLLHVVFYLRLSIGWRRIPRTRSQISQNAFSIIIPVRNEEKTIVKILQKLEKQNYSKERFEVIIVDDFSEDKTVTAIQSLKKSLSIDLRVIQLDDKEKQGKKQAITAGVEAAKYDLILTTDADCWFDEDWIKSYSKAFDDSTNMIAGPVAIRGNSLFSRLQQVEFAGLIGFGAVTISEENPSMCSGANLGFRKQAFKEVGGYTNNLFTPSGDDEFLLFNIMKKFPQSTKFLKDKGAVVSTSAHDRLSSFLNQRTRWTSKWKYNKNSSVRVSAILFFVDYLIYCAAIIGLFWGMFSIELVAGITLLRFLSMWTFIGPVNAFMQGKGTGLPLLFLQIIYPFHVLFMGMNSIFGSYTWKGRKYT